MSKGCEGRLTSVFSCPAPAATLGPCVTDVSASGGTVRRSVCVVRLFLSNFSDLRLTILPPVCVPPFLSDCGSSVSYRVACVVCFCFSRLWDPFALSVAVSSVPGSFLFAHCSQSLSCQRSMLYS